LRFEKFAKRKKTDWFSRISWRNGYIKTGRE